MSERSTYHMSSIEQGLIETALLKKPETDKGKVSGVYLFPPHFPAFAGHFPGQPVLPAVVQLAAVRILVEKTLEKELIPVSIERARFKSMIGPDEPVTVHLTFTEDQGEVRISFLITTGKGNASKGEMICRYPSE